MEGIELIDSQHTLHLVFFTCGLGAVFDWNLVWGQAEKNNCIQ